MAISLPLIARISRSFRPSSSRPRKMTFPEISAPGVRIRPSMPIIETLLPEPDSPTIPSTSPSSTEKERPCTAVKEPKLTRRSWTSSSMAHPRVEPGVQDVHHGVGQHDEEGGVEHGAHDHGQVQALQRLVGELADAG